MERKEEETKPFLPLIVMGNVRLLEVKMDKLGALMRMQTEYKESHFAAEDVQSKL